MTNPDDPNSDYDALIQEAITRTQAAQQQAAQQAQAPRTQNGATVDSGVRNVENKLRGGTPRTEESLHILGAGKSFKPGEY